MKLIILIVLVVVRLSESGFQKDLDLDITFPPILDRRQGMLTGHLRPLGWQNRAEGAIKEEFVTLRADRFWDQYVNMSQPVVLRGLVMGSDATDKWSDIYLNRAYGHLDIKVTQRRQTFKSIEENKTQMSLKKFLQNYRVEDWYLRCIMPEEMQAEAPIPHLINCGPFIIDDSSSSSLAEDMDKEKFRSRLAKEILASHQATDEEHPDTPKLAQLIEPYLWISAGETSSLLHSHPEHNLHCVLDGRKDFILISTSQFQYRTTSTDPEKKFWWRKQLDLYETFKNSDEWYSQIDVDKVNAYKYKLLQEVKWYWASLRAGDCIFVPSGWLHQIRSYGRGISISVYFNIMQIGRNRDQLGAIKVDQFRLCDPAAPLFDTLASVSPHFLWTYTHSERHLSRKSFTRAGHAKNYLLYLLRQDQLLHFERFEDFFDEITAELKKELDLFVPAIKQIVSLNASQVWANFYDESETADRTFLTLEQITQLGHAQLDLFLKLLNLVANFHDFGSEYKLTRDEL